LKLKKHDESGKSFLPKIKKVNHIKELLLYPITAIESLREMCFLLA